jgi:hypothetical protein
MVTSDEASGTFKCPTQNFSDFIENRVPLHFKFAADNFKRDNKDVFSRTRFEPNISIKPDESNWDCGKIFFAVFPSTYPSFGRTGFFQIPMRFSKIFSLHAHASAHT